MRFWKAKKKPEGTSGKAAEVYSVSNESGSRLPESIRLADLLLRLREEVDQAKLELERSGKTPLFSLDDAQVTVQFLVEKKAGGGVSFQVPVVSPLSIDATAEYAKSLAQTLTLGLKPLVVTNVAGRSDTPPPPRD